jgi:hypothetical protein
MAAKMPSTIAAPFMTTDGLDRDFDGLVRELTSELTFFRRTKRLCKTQLWRRAYCRAVSAYIEAIISWMARYTILLYHPGQLGDDERATLENSKLSALKRAFHALDLFTNTSGAESPLQRHSIEWISLDRLIKIRNRITHPKSTEDLLVTDVDHAAVERAVDVLFYLISESLKRNSRALTKRLRKFEQARQKWRPKNDAADARV